MFEPVIKVPKILNKDDCRKEIDFFLRNPRDYLTIDFADFFHINPGGLEQFLAAAYGLKETKGHLQFVNVNESGYRALMNTNVSGKRLISLAEIYTQRDSTDIAGTLLSITQNNSQFSVSRQRLIDIAKASKVSYDGQHRGSIADEPNKRELDRRRKEYGLIQCIRLIEENNTGILDHLGYRYGEVKKILTPDNPDITSYEPPQHTAPVQPRVRLPRRNPNHNTGVCKWFNDSIGYGFLIPGDGGPDIFVDINDTRSFLGCSEGKNYSYNMVEGKRGPKAENVMLIED